MADGEDWSLPTLREHFLALMLEAEKRNEQRFAAQEKAVAAALQAAKEAVLKAETAAERRFEGVNEFRQTLSDQAARLMPRAESEALHKSHDARLKTIETSIAADRGRAHGGSAMWGYVAGAIIMLIMGAGLILTIVARAPA